MALFCSIFVPKGKKTDCYGKKAKSTRNRTKFPSISTSLLLYLVNVKDFSAALQLWLGKARNTQNPLESEKKGIPGQVPAWGGLPVPIPDGNT